MTRPDASFFPKRLFVFLFICSAVGALLLARAVDVTIIRGSEYRKIADNNRFYERTVLPPRAVFFDRNGKQLVHNSIIYSAVVSKGYSTDAIGDVAEISAEQALSLSLSSPSAVLTKVVRSKDVLESLSHVVGYLGYADPLSDGSIRVPDERVGKTGVERVFDSRLRGEAGKDTFEVSARGTIVRLVLSQAPKGGADITLSIDSTLQEIAYQALAGKKGAVVVSNPTTGELLTLASSPGFKISSLKDALKDADKPLLNRAVQAYPPGSTFKMITALSALSSKAIELDTTVLDEGKITVGETEFRNWFYRSGGRTEGEIDVRKALARSNDIFFYSIAAKVGPDEIARTARLFHLGSLSGVGLVEERAGLVPTQAWKDKEIGEKWYLGDTYHYGIGQGFVLATPLQINAMTAAIGNKGMYCAPTLEKRLSGKCEDLMFAKENIDAVIDGMVGACDPGGTAFPFFEMNATAQATDKIACKTGTAEHGPVDNSGKRATHAWFTMIYPREDAKVAITVFLESDDERKFLEGSSDASPIAKTVFEEWKKLN